VDSGGPFFGKRGYHESTIAARAITIKLATVGLLGILALAGLSWKFGRSISLPISVVAERLRRGARVTAETTSELSNKSALLAEAASNQAASIEETSASLEETSSMTRQNADNASVAKGLAGDTRGAAEEGGRSLAQMRSALQEIDVAGNQMKSSLTALQESGKKVSNIVKTIDEIAFQTNILALNAAVEAARAGEAGMGFAVVADEVRNLAQRSASAARETASIVEESISKSRESVEASANLAARLGDVVQSSDAVGSALEAIIQKAREVDSVVAQIATACHEQSEGVTQISAAVSNMDQLTQDNAANANEGSVIATSLQDQVQSLLGEVSSLESLVGNRSQGKEMAEEHGSSSPVELMKKPDPAPSPAQGFEDFFFSEAAPRPGSHRGVTNGFETGSFESSRN